MKKCTFYSMTRTSDGPAAVLRDGYDDGTFYYYNNGGLWMAIHPATGCAVAWSNTRKACAENAHAPGMAETIAGAVQRAPEAVRSFAEAVKKAKEAA